MDSYGGSTSFGSSGSSWDRTSGLSYSSSRSSSSRRSSRRHDHYDYGGSASDAVAFWGVVLLLFVVVPQLGGWLEWIANARLHIPDGQFNLPMAIIWTSCCAALGWLAYAMPAQGFFFSDSYVAVSDEVHYTLGTLAGVGGGLLYFALTNDAGWYYFFLSTVAGFLVGFRLILTCFLIASALTCLLIAAAGMLLVTMIFGILSTVGSLIFN